MTKNFSTEINNLSLGDIFPYIENEEYLNLLIRLMHSRINDSDEFIVSEAIKIYMDTEDDNLKIRILELLKRTDF